MSCVVDRSRGPPPFSPNFHLNEWERVSCYWTGVVGRQHGCVELRRELSLILIGGVFDCCVDVDLVEERLTREVREAVVEHEQNLGGTAQHKGRTDGLRIGLVALRELQHAPFARSRSDSS